MPRTILYRGLPGEGLDTFIGDFSEAASEDPFAIWLILPTNRLVRTVTKKIADKNIPFIPSHICTLREFCKDYFERNRATARFLGKAESNLIIQQILLENKSRLPLFFTRDRPGAGTIESLQDFFNVIRRRKIAYPECLRDLKGEKSRQIGLVLNSYRERLRDRDLVDSDSILEWTISHLSSSTGMQFGHVFVYGLFEPLPLEQDLLSAIRLSSQELTVYEPTGADETIYRNAQNWAGVATRIDTIEASSGTPDLTGLFSASGEIWMGERIRVSSFATPYQELACVAEEICLLHEQRVPYSSIALAFPDIREKTGFIEEVFSDFGIPWNIATGKKVSRVPIVQYLQDIIGVVAGRYSREDVVRLVESPYFRYSGISNLDGPGIDIVSRYAQIEHGKEQWLNRLDALDKRFAGSETKGDTVPISRETVARVRKGIEHLFGDLSSLEGKRLLREYGKDYSSLIRRWGFEGPVFHEDTRIRAEEHTALKKVWDCLKNVDRIADILSDRPVTAGDFLRIFSSFTGETDILPETDRNGVSVVGIRECVHEHWDYLFLAGLTEGDMPSLTTRIPFTNLLENARMGTRTLGEILREQKYYFIAALLSGQKAVYLSAPLSDGENPLLTSAFLERVKERTTAGSWEQPAGSHFSHSRRAEAVHAGSLAAQGDVCGSLSHLTPDICIDDLVDLVNIERYYRQGRCDSLFDGILLGEERICGVLAERYSPVHVYSATALETYAVCPFRFFTEKVLGIEALPEVEPNLSARDRGTVIHNILSNFYRAWRTLGQTKILPSVLADAADLMVRIVREELDRYSFESPVWKATCIQMTGGGGAGPGIFQKFLEYEAGEGESPLVPAFFELTFGMRSDEDDDPASVHEPIEIDAGDGSERIRIKGRIDRIDITPDGLFTICDYKTGSQLVSRIEIGTGKALQIPLYILAFEKISGKRGVAGGYYRMRRDIENRIVLMDEAGADLILTSNPRVTKNYRDVLSGSQKFAREYIRRIRAGCFPLPPEEKCPNPYCEFRTVCRFSPTRAFACREEA